MTTVSGQRREDYKYAFASPEGQRVLNDLCTQFHLFSSMASPGDPYELHFKEGQRDVVLHILNMTEEKANAKKVNKVKEQAAFDYER